MKYKKYIYIIITLLGICLIFSFSLYDAQASSVMSDKVGQIILERFPFIAEHVPGDLVANFGLNIRKWAHFIEFFVLGVFVYLIFRQTVVRHKILVAFALCVLVGVMDESIQCFIDGRTSQFSDVLIDSFGGFVGIVIGKCLPRKLHENK